MRDENGEALLDENDEPFHSNQSSKTQTMTSG